MTEIKLCDECKKPLEGKIKHPFKAGKKIDTCEPCYIKITSKKTDVACDTCGKVIEFCDCNKTIEEEYTDKQREIALELIKTRKHIDFIEEVHNRFHYGDKSVKIIHYCSFMSVHLDNPLLHIVNNSESGSGKSSMTDKTYYLLPTHFTKHFDSLSGQHLAYAGKKNPSIFKGKVIIIDEIAEMDTLKTLAKPGCGALDKIRGTVSEGEAVELTLKGAFVLWGNCVLPFDKVEYRNRVISPQLSLNGRNDKHKFVLNAVCNNQLFEQVLKNPNVMNDIKICRCIFNEIVKMAKPITIDLNIIPENFRKLYADGMIPTLAEYIMNTLSIGESQYFVSFLKSYSHLYQKVLTPDDILNLIHLWYDSCGQHSSNIERAILTLLEPCAIEHSIIYINQDTQQQEIANMLRGTKTQIYRGLTDGMNITVSYESVRKSIDKMVDKGMLGEEANPNKPNQNLYFFIHR